VLAVCNSTVNSRPPTGPAQLQQTLIPTSDVSDVAASLWQLSNAASAVTVVDGQTPLHGSSVPRQQMANYAPLGGQVRQTCTTFPSCIIIIFALLSAGHRHLLLSCV
jgi:hypothetical protein